MPSPIYGNKTVGMAVKNYTKTESFEIYFKTWGSEKR